MPAGGEIGGAGAVCWEGSGTGGGELAGGGPVEEESAGPVLLGRASADMGGALGGGLILGIVKALKTLCSRRLRMCGNAEGHCSESHKPSVAALVNRSSSG